MKGYLDVQTQGSFASERRVRESLSRVAPIYHQRRQRGAERLINPQSYTAQYHGHKLHMDQNLSVQSMVFLGTFLLLFACPQRTMS